MATLQTPEPIEDYHLAPSNRAAMWFHILATEREHEWALDDDAPYQRGHVWGEQRRRLLIKSIMLGVPIGSIILNDRMGAGFQHYSQDRRVLSRDWAHAVVDGKQRIRAITAFMSDQLAVPASWFKREYVLATEATDDGPYVRWSGLSRTAQARFENRPVSTIVARVPTLDAEREIFDLINFGGVPQGASDHEGS